MLRTRTTSSDLIGYDKQTVTTDISQPAAVQSSHQANTKIKQILLHLVNRFILSVM